AAAKWRVERPSFPIGPLIFPTFHGAPRDHSEDPAILAAVPYRSPHVKTQSFAPVPPAVLRLRGRFRCSAGRSARGRYHLPMGSGPVRGSAHPALPDPGLGHDPATTEEARVLSHHERARRPRHHVRPELPAQPEDPPRG